MCVKRRKYTSVVAHEFGPALCTTVDVPFFGVRNRYPVYSGFARTDLSLRAPTPTHNTDDVLQRRRDGRGGAELEHIVCFLGDLPFTTLTIKLLL